MFLLCALLSPAMTLATISIAAIGTLLYFRLGVSLQSKTSALKHHENELAERLGEVFQNFKFFRLWDSGGRIEGMLVEHIERYSGLHIDVHRELNRVRMLAECSVVLVLSIFLLLAFFVLRLDPGTMLVFLAIFYRLAPRLLAMNSLLVASEVELRFLGDWNARMLRLAPQGLPRRAEPASSNAAPLAGDLVVNGLSALAPGGTKEILSNVSFTLPKGGTIAIIGESGAGKTSLMDALCGLLPLSSGSVSVNGTQLSDEGLKAWVRDAAVVLQQTPVLRGTILENVAWDDATPSLARAKDAAREAHALAFIEKLPQRWETPIGRGNNGLSGGEVQRLGLTRALYRESELIFLDEPTSSLDAEAEDAVIKALSALKGKRTLLLITHRLKAARIADSIIVLRDGKVAEQGTWAELAGKEGGILAGLAARQGVLVS